MPDTALAPRPTLLWKIPSFPRLFGSVVSAQEPQCQSRPLWDPGATGRGGRMRCAAAVAGALCGGSFAERLASLDVEVARLRAGSQCQVTWVPSGGGGSPSNKRLERAGDALVVRAAGARRQCAPAALARSRPP